MSSSSSPSHQQPTQKRRALTSAAPMYITIGPQCCGKTSCLQKIPNIADVSLDDQLDVYVPVPTRLWLGLSGGGDSGANESKQEDEQVLGQEYQGKTLLERMESDDNSELRLVLGRWNGDLSPEEFAFKLAELYSEQNRPDVVATALIEAVQSFLSSPNITLPEKTLVFCLESLFRPHAETNQSAIQRGHFLLRTTPTHIPIAWGNTNSKLKDFQQALEIACQARRPVRFIIAGETNSCNVDLPWVDCSVLLRRNLQRLQETGKYVPAFAIVDCMARTKQLIAEAKQIANGAATDQDNSTRSATSPGSLEQSLVAMASRPPDNPRHRQTSARPYKFVLNEHNLLQKQFPPQAPSGGPQRGRGGRPHNAGRGPRQRPPGSGPPGSGPPSSQPKRSYGRRENGSGWNNNNNERRSRHPQQQRRPYDNGYDSRGGRQDPDQQRWNRQDRPNGDDRDGWAENEGREGHPQRRPPGERRFSSPPRPKHVEQNKRHRST